MSEKEKKNRFEISREVQEEFVNGIAETMLALAEKAGEWKMAGQAMSRSGFPFVRQQAGNTAARTWFAS